MKTTPVRLEAGVVAFVRTLAPEPRARVRRALRQLERGRGDIKALEEDLAGYYRLRVGAHRLVFRYARDGGRRHIRVVFAERRRVVYELFAAVLRHE